MPEAITIRPVRLALHGLGGYGTVNTVEDAAECLLHHWPVHEGEAYLAASEMLLGAMNGKYTPDDARSAFITAAREADIDVID